MIGEGEPVPSNQANVISLKSALKDPAFVNRIQNLEDRRQDIYIKMLKKRGQLVENEDGSQTIVSYPKVKNYDIKVQAFIKYSFIRLPSSFQII